MKPARFLIRLILLTVLTPVLAARESKDGPPPIGFSLQVSADGLFKPKVTKAVVTAVVPGSQAAAAGLAVGDELVRIEGVAVPGTAGSVLKPHMAFVPGKPKKFVFKRTTGREYEAVLTQQPGR
jgi:S1-C subfamily serine protease